MIDLKLCPVYCYEKRLVVTVGWLVEKVEYKFLKKNDEMNLELNFSKLMNEVVYVCELR